MKKIGRPKTYLPTTRVRLLGMPSHRINSGSLRETVVSVMMDTGEATIEELGIITGKDCERAVRALLRAGWLEVVK